ncbi:GNAT family N-acetyltransferase [Actinomadura kijaniata]|uniref:RimJ/RimL family protein N-acetyltransferase n=1 Tax=Actinomadura namibiensis TaxID=182080 RepID=A0A7W3LQ09_ACTNM|nr:GNAT family N-acetyltransferase [Actinomadura namibiensis]MBA8952174.1 RimJ/RimL family protein N-acetyltransferase [Actinomadura namibiensis]
MFGPIGEIIETQRLRLEPLAVHHADEMAEVLDDPRLHDYIGGEPLTRDELRARYERLVAGPAPFHQEGWLNWVIFRRRDEQPVGYVQATVTPSPTALKASIAWVTGMPYQGFGFATEAAGAMVGWLRAHGVTEITASIHPENASSAAVARKLGLHPTPDVDDGETVWRVPSS